jgi:hypothetical protein
LSTGRDSPTGGRTGPLSVAKLPFCSLHPTKDAEQPCSRQGAKDINAIPRQANLLHSSCGLQIQAFSHLTATEPLAKAQYSFSPLIKARDPQSANETSSIHPPQFSTHQFFDSVPAQTQDPVDPQISRSSLSTISAYRNIAHYIQKMGVEKVVLKRGNSKDVPKKHDEVSMEYTGT